MVDVYPYHIIGGLISVEFESLVKPVNINVLADEIRDGKIQSAAYLEFSSRNPLPNFGDHSLYYTDLAPNITGVSPFDPNPVNTVSHITHLLLANSNEIDVENLIFSMTILYSL